MLIELILVLLIKEEELPKQEQPVCRSQSLPMTSISRRFTHNYKRKRVADSSSLPGRFRVSSTVPVLESSPSEGEGAGEEEVGEEETVCRICFVALCEGSVLKLECHCKGELALAHRDCALKWFGIKGNANCDVCSHDVLNLPVTLRRVRSSSSTAIPVSIPAAQAAEEAAIIGPAERGGFRGVWQHGTTPILVIVSMLAYFCFLEQLLVGDHGTAALAISLPFAGVLGLFSSLTTTKMVSRRYLWIYSALQFLFIVLFTHLFYRYVRLQAVIAIILATFAGFGVAICSNAIIVQIIRWKQARHLPPSDSDLPTAQP